MPGARKIMADEARTRCEKVLKSLPTSGPVNGIDDQAVSRLAGCTVADTLQISSRSYLPLSPNYRFRGGKQPFSVCAGEQKKKERKEVSCEHCPCRATRHR